MLPEHCSLNNQKMKQVHKKSSTQESTVLMKSVHKHLSETGWTPRYQHSLVLAPRVPWIVWPMELSSLIYTQVETPYLLSLWGKAFTDFNGKYIFLPEVTKRCSSYKGQTTNSWFGKQIWLLTHKVFKSKPASSHHINMQNLSLESYRLWIM
jgi:hypothetical protein